jgi:hypothetical protein
MTFEYKGPRGYLDKVEIIWETNRWDGPLAGYCRVGNDMLYFCPMNLITQTGDTHLFVDYIETYGMDYEEVEKEAKELGETVDQYIQDQDMVRFYKAYYHPKHILLNGYKRQVMFETCTALSPEGLEDQLKNMKNSEEYIALKEESELYDMTNKESCIGWFMSYNIKSNTYIDKYEDQEWLKEYFGV